MSEIEYQCGRCGSSIAFEDCSNCGGEGVTGHDCGEDCCCCADPEDNVTCDICQGSGTFPYCLSSREWCESHPLPGREKIARSTPESFTVPSRKEKSGMSEIEYKRTSVDEDCDDLRRGNASYSTPKEDAMLILSLGIAAIILGLAIAYLWRHL